MVEHLISLSKSRLSDTVFSQEYL